MTRAKTFYHNCLTEDLQQVVHGQLTKLIPEQLALNEEVAIHKSRCADAVKEWSTARQIYNTLCKTPGIDQNDLVSARVALDRASASMADALKEHKDLTLTAASVEAKTQVAVTERTIMLFLNAAIDLAHELFNNGTKASQDLMELYENQLRERVIVQEADSNSLAIEGELYAMMQTIEGPKGAAQELIN